MGLRGAQMCVPVRSPAGASQRANMSGLVRLQSRTSEGRMCEGYVHTSHCLEAENGPAHTLLTAPLQESSQPGRTVCGGVVVCVRDCFYVCVNSIAQK